MQSKLLTSAFVLQSAFSIHLDEAATANATATTQAKAKCPFGYDSPASATFAETKAEVNYIEEMFEESLNYSKGFDSNDYDTIAEKIFKKFDDLPEVLAAQSNQRGAFVGCLLRTAGHDFMDFRPDEEHIGGSDGCINFKDEDNKGIQQCLDKYGIPALFSEHSDKVSLADFLVVIAEAAMARAHSSYGDTSGAKTLYTRFREGFKIGRKSEPHCEWNEGRMPNPENSCHGTGDLGPGKEGLEQIFVDNIYRGRKDAWTMTAAISGAHTVGGARLENSGYNGYWSDVENQGLFNNDYFRSIVLKGWAPEQRVQGNKKKNQWKRVDIPINKTEEDLAAELKSRKLSKRVYDVQLEALRDPKRGLYENPKEGIKGHHEMMLTTDMCMAFTRNKRLGYCFGNHKQFNDGDKRGAVKIAHGLECRDNFWRGVDFEDLRGEGDNCCAWYKVKNSYNFGVYKYETMNTESKRICNVDLKNTRINKETCCQAQERRWECGEQYWGGGPAYEDIMEFARDEDIWIRKFLEAWHHATENGNNNLFYILGKKIGDARHNLEDKHAVQCRGMAWDECKATEECHDVNVGMAANEMRHWFKACRNKHLLVTEQQEEGETFRNYRRRYMTTLVNPTQSSTLSDLYPAVNPLGQQNRDQYELNEAKNTAFHPFLHQEMDLHTTGRNANRTRTSCAISKPVSADQPETWWAADFEEGEVEVAMVMVWGETYKVLYDRGLFGMEVYIGDQYCGKITPETWTEPWEVTMTKATTRKYGNGYQIYCDEPVRGSSVKLVSTRASKETDHYQSGLAICDVRVHTSDMEPTFANNSKDIDAWFMTHKPSWPLHTDLDVPFGQTEAGKKNPSEFHKCEYVLQ